MSELKVNKISPATGTETTLGDSSDDFLLPSGAEIIAQSGSTITVASGATIANVGTATGFGSSGLTLGTQQVTTSGTGFTFGSIPAGVSLIFINWYNVSTDGSADIEVTIGDAGGLEDTGYVSTGGYSDESGGSGASTSTTGFRIEAGSSGSITLSGASILTLHNGTTEWLFSHISRSHDTACTYAGGHKTLSAELTQVRVDTTGSDNFDLGALNISYM